MSPKAWPAMLLLLASPLRAQAVLGPADDATIAPPGATRLRIETSWQHYGLTNVDSASRVESYAQVRFTTFTAEFGVAKRLSVGFIAPEAGTLVTSSKFTPAIPKDQLDTIVTTSHNGIGDIEVGGKFAWLAGPGEAERIALGPGLHVRAAVSAFYRFTTGTPPDPLDYFGVATGSGRTALTLSSQNDLLFGRVFWLTALARYQWPGSVTRDVQLFAGGDPLGQSYGTVRATQTGGNEWLLQATPRVTLGRYFAIGAQYTYRHRDASSFAGTRDTIIGSDTVHLDASVLDSLSGGTAQYLGGTATYSTVAAYLQGKASFPIEISYTYAGTLTADGSLPKQAATNTVTIRLWLHMWGAAFKKGIAKTP